MKKEKEGVDPEKLDGAIFPNHLNIQAVNYSVDLGSFDLSMVELQVIALDCMKQMRRIEQEK